MTVKLVASVALPPGVVTTIFPVVAPVGTVAVTCVSESTVIAAGLPLNVTLVACIRPVPVMVTGVPAGPLGGVNDVNVGVTRKVCELVSVLAPVVTVTVPVSAPAGTVALMYVVPLRVMLVACVPPNLTTEELLNPWPRMPICAPSLPEVVCNCTNGPRPVDRLKMVP